jgi:tetratricopeptide (TPR) repeat protein
LPGATLEHLLAGAGARLPVERVVGIAVQTCLGLQAAHEQGLIHRDLKPSNIFVMEDDTIKIIDFGLVDLVGAESMERAQGTLQYMAPEQLDRKPVSPACDIFSLGVVCYQALTGRRPFDRGTEAETADAVRRYMPPHVSELNPQVSRIVSRVIHKAMAKNPWHRFSTPREFAETLQKALNGQAIERFDRAKVQPRIDRARKAYLEGDHQFASEILTELEAEGNIDSEMTLLRIQIDQAVRQQSIRQLLDTARTRIQEDEFPLALQKIQEVLGIAPDNSEAIGLKNDIEKKRTERQTENWFRLVEQHLQNQAFDQAKQGLEEILKANAGDQRAAGLLADLDRREQEIQRRREENERRYQSAVNCFLQGQLQAALSQLEQVLDLHREHPDSAHPDQVARYHGLYNQIRTELEAARNSYAEARQHLAAHNFTRALEVCSAFLKRAPGDTMFQALEMEAKEHQRQEQSAFLAEITCRVEAEPDLDRRAAILQDAVERYPEESHLQESLRLVRERRELVNSIVAKARLYEERGQFDEALGQFEILRDVYALYPGINQETGRLKQRRDEQAREEAKRRWVESVECNIATGDYSKSNELAQAAMAEFPGDSELSALEQTVRQCLNRKAESAKWLELGRKLCSDRNFADGLEALRKAASLDPRNPVHRVALLDALIEKARSVVDQDWRAAEPLVEEALGVDAEHIQAKSLQGLVLDYKRREVVNECVAQARKLQAAGDAAAALAGVEAMLVSYPNETRLVLLRSTLRNLCAPPSMAVAASQVGPAGAPAGTNEDSPAATHPQHHAPGGANIAPAKSAEPLQKASHQAPVKAQVSEPRPAVTRAAVIREKISATTPAAHQSDATVLKSPAHRNTSTSPPLRPSTAGAATTSSAAGSVRPSTARPAAAPALRPPASRALSTSAADTIPDRPPTRVGLALRDCLGHAGKILNFALKGLRELARLLQSWAEPKGLGSILQWVIIGSAVVILVMASGVNFQRRRKPVSTAPAAADYLVQVQSNVANARYLVDDKPAAEFPIRLKPGEHKLEAASLGYLPEVRLFTLAADAPKPFPVSFQLMPELMRLRLSSGLKSATVLLDGRPADLQDGGLAADGMALAVDHTLALVQSGQETLGFSFRADPAGIVALAPASIRAKDMNAVMISTLGSRARVYATDPSLKGGLKGQTLQPILAEGLEYGGLNGTAEFVVDDGKMPRLLPIDFSNAPMLSIWLASDPNQVTILVDAGVPGADAIIDGGKPQGLRSGPRYFKLEPGAHTVRIVKNGYEPAEQKVELAKKGDYRKLAFSLKPVVRFASLAIEGAPADAEVLIDGSSAGNVKGDGSLDLANIAPGAHTITLRKPEFEEKRLAKTFAAGQAARLAGPEAQLTPFGGIDFHVLPRSATVTYQSAEESQAHRVENGKALKLKPGRYTVKASSGPSQDREEQIIVEPGRIHTIGWTFAALEAPKKAAVPSTGSAARRMLTRDYFQDPESWTEDGPWSIHTSGGQSWLRNNRGAYVIEIRRQKGGILNRTRRVEWVIDHRGSDDHVDYSFDFGSLERRVTVDGKTSKPQKRAIHAQSDTYTVRIEITSQQIVIRDLEGKELDRYQRPNPEEPLGTFGFKGEVALMARAADSH